MQHGGTCRLSGSFSTRASVPAVFAAAVFVGVLGCAPLSRNDSTPIATTRAITATDVRTRIFVVAHDSMQGRQAGHPGNFAMTAYLAREAARMGLEPGGEGGTWFQNVPMVLRATDSASSVVVDGKALQLFKDFALVRPTSTLRLSTRGIAREVSAVYGGRAGDSAATITTEQAAGRLVILDAPLGASGLPTGVYATPAALAVSRFPGAAAIAIASLDLLSPAAAASLPSRSSGIAQPATGQVRPAGLLLSASAAEMIMGAPLLSFAPGARGRAVRLSLSFDDRPTRAPARNVIGIVRGSDPLLRGQFVAVGAHNDHVGIAARPVEHDSLRAFNRIMRPEGAQSSARQPTPEQWKNIALLLDSLRKLRPPRMDSINNGADDDGSGSVAALEAAEAIAAGRRPRRSIIFVWHTAEESGLIGSAWFADHPTVQRDSIIAQINMDMVGRGAATDRVGGGPRSIQVIGSRRRSTELGDVVDSVNARRETPYEIDYSFDAPRHPQNRYCRSDHYMYARAGIPIAYISRGYHIDYHLVTDEPQYINYQGLADVSGFVRDIAVALADRNTRPAHDKAGPDPLGPCRQ